MMNTKTHSLENMPPQPQLEGHTTLPLGGESQLLLEHRALRRNAILLAMLALSSIAFLGMGSMVLSPLQVIQALLGQGSELNQFIIQHLRLERLLAAIFTGAAFSLAGCLMQTLARNRLATPGIIGIDNAAMAFAVSSIVSTGISLAPSAMALAGAATATALAFGLAGSSGTRGYRFIVAGIGIGAIAGALTQLMLSQVDIDTANAAYPWTVGSLSARSSSMVYALGIGLLISLIACLIWARRFALLPFSDQVITGLGEQIKKIRVAALSLSVLLTGLAVAVAGPVGLVALVGPELARAMSGYRGIPLIGSAIAGAFIMVVADLVGRTLLSPIELPVGIVTSIVGAPYLIWILVRRSPRN
ncbi:FecCD family ABC transporter permease [Marinomonas pollencensis]|uniref:Iron complex transport system permease protein n=1 Tax=Marinomonas pollencensis TaxID=491954 RepID=A0A3E0DU11_9GAMM|nr:iron ABC transporter permease [Marinomonas pollencensis]REG84968.1 iron complex transport system permease protein [Marinomonas pollencensis]